MAINNKNVSTRVKPANMTDDAWLVELRTKSAAQLAVYDVVAPVFCCNDAIQACPDHDSDVAGYKAAKAALRAKVQASGVASLTAADLAPLLFRLVNCLEKNMEKSG